MARNPYLFIITKTVGNHVATVLLPNKVDRSFEPLLLFSVSMVSISSHCQIKKTKLLLSLIHIFPEYGTK